MRLAGSSSSGNCPHQNHGTYYACGLQSMKVLAQGLLMWMWRVGALLPILILVIQLNCVHGQPACEGVWSHRKWVVPLCGGC